MKTANIRLSEEIGKQCNMRSIPCWLIAVFCASVYSCAEGVRKGPYHWTELPSLSLYEIQVNLDMTDHYMTDFCIWRTICLVPVRCISSIRHMYTTDFAYDRPIFLVPLSLSYPSSPVLWNTYVNSTLAILPIPLYTVPLDNFLARNFRRSVSFSAFRLVDITDKLKIK